MIILPQYAVARVIELVKSGPSRPLREKFPRFLRKVPWDGKGIWGRGFLVSTVGITEAIIQQ